jgi:aldehyde dehydrogenase (NAD+)
MSAAADTDRSSPSAPELYARLGLAPEDLRGAFGVRSPIDGKTIARVRIDSVADSARAIAEALESFGLLRVLPAPRRGELIRRFGSALREHKQTLGALVSLESGKILQEAYGEVQEMIDICDFAVGLSRQLYGLTIASERPAHRMFETWQPLGPVGVISAFNFPAAVWAWNFALAIVCGDPVIWKPSEKTPITALACHGLFQSVLRELSGFPPHLSRVLVGGAELGQALATDPRIALLSATGSCRMGRTVAPIVAQRLGRCLLELGGNNAMIVTEGADLSLATRAILFSAVGTAGQRCTSLRRLIVHESVRDALLARLKTSYGQVRIGSPLEATTLMGPLIDRASYEQMQRALERARGEGGVITGGERVLADAYPDAYYVRPAIAEMPSQTAVVLEETFAPILYVVGYRSLDDAIALHNAAEQGLASCIFTSDLREAERFLSPAGSDCGIANVNIGPSGAEIGGAFGGEKATGGGREAGSDAWKNYMRRQTSTINYSSELPLAQGIEFE